MGERKAGFIPAVTYAPSKHLQATRHSGRGPAGEACFPRARSQGRINRKEPKGCRKAGFTPAVTYALSKHLQATRYSGRGPAGEACFPRAVFR